MNRSRILSAAALCLPLLATACVSQGKYDAAVEDASLARAELAHTKHVMQQRLDMSEEGRAEMQKDIDRTAESTKDMLAIERQRQDDLARAHEAAEARASLYRELALKFKGMVDSGDLAITLRQGRMVLRLPNDVLFDSGQSALKPAGKRTLAEVAAVLETIPGRRFQIGGHTDTQPIRQSRYKSNWDLSTARALEVTSFLIANGMDPHVVSAAGYGEFDPADTNETKEGMTRNRRTEISLQPNIEELVSVP